MRRLILVVAGAVMSATPVLLSAQVMPTRVIRRGEFLTFELSDGEPISFLLEYARQLDLSEDQKVQFMGIRRRLRQTNAPFMRQLDSLREAVGVSLEPRQRMAPGDGEALERFQKLSTVIVDSMRINNQAAQGEAKLLLTRPQLARLDSLVRFLQDSTSGRGRRPPRSP
jgi:hypothetical protein